MENLDVVFAEKIASEYAQKQTAKVVALKKLDTKAKLPANIFGYVFGVAGTLVLGIGMCLSMGIIGKGLEAGMAIGVVVGIIGIAMVSVNYPIYNRLLQNGKKKYAFEILELAKQISGE